MKIKDLEKLLKKLLEAVQELNGEYQEGWDDVIEETEALLKDFKIIDYE